jgi:pimeloyl-ACP methyl ester carboxylesterase
MESSGSALRVVALLAFSALLLTGCIERRVVEGIEDELTQGEFYQMPADLAAGAPGEIIRSEPILEAPLGTRAWRVIYHSTDMAGADVAVSGVIIVPDSPAPAGGRVLVSWAHPTTGSAAHCAPSLGPDPFFGIEGLDALLVAGYAIAATDYPGMGVAGDSSYLLGITESNAVLDAARAARNLDGTDAGDRLLLWGHSQGGQAALFAAQRAAEYAPELTLEAVAVAAPAANLNALISDDIVDVSGVTISSYAFPAYEVAYADRFPEASIEGLLTPAGSAAVPQIAGLCLLSQHPQVAAIAEPLVGGFVSADPGATEPWATMLRENSAGGSPIGVPVYVGQGLADTLVVPTTTEGYVAGLCSAGESVLFERFDGVTHAMAAFASLPTLTAWFAGVLEGDVESNCT